MIEKTIDRIQNHQIQIEKKNRPTEIGERRGECRELPPAALLSFRQIHRRQRQRLDGLIQTIRVVRKAHESMRPREVSRHHRTQPIHVIGAKLRAPLHADDIDHARGRIDSDSSLSTEEKAFVRATDCKGLETDPSARVRKSYWLWRRGHSHPSVRFK